ncbi:MAG: hypothetical protein IJ122_06330 [Methanobrevibacter sp.]|nr:hypothetical protein [Methanobrevibacter sp.]
MNITLEDYQKFANKINFDSTLVDHVFCYKNNKSNLILTPFQLGELYREYEKYRIQGSNELLSKLNEVMKSKTKNKNLTLQECLTTINDFIKFEKTGLQSQLNRLK